ncbi:MAG: FMN-binding protein [Eubacteriaceae bacterium]|nr:FMN-binding protein [Eubacteriaceae bacterium]
MKKAIFSLLLVGMVSVFVLGCSSQETKVLTGTGKGLEGNITVEVTLKGDKITAIEMTEFNDTKGIGDAAAKRIIEQAIEKGTIDGVESVSGASYSSAGTIAAIKDAISKK